MRNTELQIFVVRFWQYARMRASGVPPAVLKKSLALVRKDFDELDLIKFRGAVADALYAHILQHTIQIYGGRTCSTCKSLGQCTREEEGICECYQRDFEGLDNCREQLFLAVRFLDKAYGISADDLIETLTVLLDSIKTHSGTRYP